MTDLAKHSGNITRSSLPETYSPIREKEVNQSDRCIQSTLSRLPPELLISIFEFVNANPNESDLFFHPHWLFFISLAHVCRSWRAIIRNCPRLWSTIILMSEEVVVEMLNRSGEGPLFVRIGQRSGISWLLNLSQVDIPSPLLFRLFNIGRLEELHLDGPRNDDLRTMLRASSESGSAAAHLRSLVIHISSQQHEREYPEFFSIPMPQLRRLDIVGLNLPWSHLTSSTHPGFAHLSFLKLTDVSQPPAGHLHLMLSQTHNLLSLHLDNVLSDTPFAGLAPATPVNLPRLSSLTLRSSTVTQIVDFLSSISYQREKAQLELLPRPMDTGTEEEKIELLKTLFDLCCISNDASTKRSHNSLALTALKDGDISITAWDSEGHTQYIPLYHRSRGLILLRPSFDMTLSFGRYDEPFPFLPYLHLPQLSALEIWDSVSTNHTEHYWIDFFERHAGITDLYIGSERAPSIIQALAMYGNTDSSWPVYLPDLVNLTFEGNGFDSCNPLDENGEVDHESGQDWEQYILEKCLCYRCSQGKAIRLLTLTECYMPEAFALSLRPFVEELCWEEPPGFPSNWEDSGSESEDSYEYRDSDDSMGEDSEEENE